MPNTAGTSVNRRSPVAGFPLPPSTVTFACSFLTGVEFRTRIRVSCRTRRWCDGGGERVRVM